MANKLYHGLVISFEDEKMREMIGKEIGIATFVVAGKDEESVRAMLAAELEKEVSPTTTPYWYVTPVGSEDLVELLGSLGLTVLAQEGRVGNELLMAMLTMGMDSGKQVD